MIYTVQTFDQYVTAYLHVWAAASVAEHNGHPFLAVVRFMAAARQAPTRGDETRSLDRAFECYERLKGPYVPSEGARA